jgi:hypothetical protein
VLRKLIGVAGAVSLFAGVLVGTQGCASSDEKVEPEKPAAVEKFPDMGSFCNGVAQAQCGKTCDDATPPACITSKVPSKCGSTAETCVATVQRDCANGNSDVTRGVTLSNYPLGKKNADDCVKAVAKAYEDGEITGTEHSAITAACARVFSPNNTLGFACTRDTDCAAPLGCYLTDVGKGTCQTITKISKAEDCSAAGSVCEKGYYCAQEVTACIARKPNGAVCTAFTKPCAEDLLCANIDEMGNGTCSGKKGNLADCGSDDECSAGYCAQVGDKHLCLDTFSLGIGAPACANFGG